jgi:hypothetical protein
MAKKTVVELFDDLDGSDATQTKHFGLNGDQYEIDLNDENAQRLDDALEEFIAAARKVRKDGQAVKPRRTHVRADAGDRKQSGAVRDWARANKHLIPEGTVVSDRGRLPKAVLDAFEAAHAVKPRGEETSAPADEVTPVFASV